MLADPNFAKYAQMGRAMLNYFAITHPSQPNYWCVRFLVFGGVRSFGHVQLTSIRDFGLLLMCCERWNG